MKVISAEYLKSFTDVRSIDLEPLPAVAFIGRSNVGKSSLINSLLNRKKLVKTSSTPGKTQLINYFLINQAFYFIDLPGYGFAKVPIAVKEQWNKMIMDFLVLGQNLKAIVQLVDVRHKPTADDKAFRAMSQHCPAPSLIIANKVDKLKKSQIKKAQKSIKEELNVNQNLLLHSTTAKIGKTEIWEQLSRLLDL